MKHGICLFALMIFCLVNFSETKSAGTLLIDEKASIQKHTNKHDGKEETIQRELMTRLSNLELEMSLLKSQSQSQMEEINLLKSRLEEQGKEIQILKAVTVQQRAPTDQRVRISRHPIRKRSKRITSDTRDTDHKIIELHSTSSEGCGISSVTDVRVTGGRDSAVGQWPWMAHIQIFGENNRKYDCGGVLISDRHVLSAAHCFEKSLSLKPGRNNINDNEVEVVLGLHNIRSPESHSVRFGESLIIYMHEDFNGKTLANDIALIQLNTEVEFNKYIKPICLPSFNHPPRLLRGTSHIAGWGRSSTRDHSQYPDILQDASVPLVHLDSCQKIFKESHTKVTGNHICAGKNGTDSCKGDSGGPLMFQIETNRWAVIGIVSWGLTSCNGEAPGVYLAVGPYVDWINEQRSGDAKPETISDVLKLVLPRIRNLENQLVSNLKNPLELEVNKTRIYFDVYRKTGIKYNGSHHEDDLTDKGVTVTYDGENVNLGEAINLKTGIFTAPQDGVYMFSFTGLKIGFHSVCRFFMQRNEITVAATYGRSNEDNNVAIPLSMFTILQLNRGDRMAVVIHWGECYDTEPELFTHFSGALLS